MLTVDFSNKISIILFQLLYFRQNSNDCRINGKNTHSTATRYPLRTQRRNAHSRGTATSSASHGGGKPSTRVGQLVYSRQGVIRVFTAHLYRDAPSTALSVPSLLREVLIALSKPSEKRCFDLLSVLFFEELENAPALPLVVRMPQDKRLRQLCEAVLQTPRLNIPLAQWARDCGASVATVQRLFKRELGCHFNAWRQQALLARATELAAQQLPLAHIALELGYRNQSAFSFMVSQCIGQTARSYFYPQGNEN